MKHINEESHYITGSNGFIGSNLCSVLLHFERGNRVKVNINEEHIVDLASYGNLATQTDIEEIYKVNYERIKIFLKLSGGYKSLILTSTSALQQENHNDYIKSKGLMENFAVDYARITKKPIAIFRPSSVAGVGEQKEHLIPTLIRSCLCGEPMKFVEFPVHDFINVKDVISAILFMEENISKCRGKVWNVSTGVGHSNNEVREMVERITGRKANIEAVDSMREYDSENWIVNNSALLGLGWKPKITLEETICSMVSAEK